MHKKSILMANLILLSCWLACNSFAAETPSASSAPLAANVFDIRQFGAVGDGKTLCSSAFAKAVAACELAGGGIVLVPPGQYLTGTITLKSNVRLHLDSGSVILASQNADDYGFATDPWATNKRWITPIIFAQDADHIAVTGSGMINGQGESWWAAARAEKERFRGRSKVEIPADFKLDPSISGASYELPKGRPVSIRFVRCKDVLIQDVTIQNSPNWNVHPIFCERVRVEGINIQSPPNSVNTDGINPESCKGVQILNCRVDTGDDCITLKSGINELGRQMGKPCEDILISNCAIYHGHGGVTIGSEMSGDVRNVVVSNCTFRGTNIALRIKSQRGRGGIVENITMNNVVMIDVPNPFDITSFYTGKDKPEDDHYIADETTPTIRNILISQVIASGAKIAGSIRGLKERPIANVNFSNVLVQADAGFSITNAAGVRFNDCAFTVSKGEVLKQTNATDVDASRLRTSSVVK